MRRALDFAILDATASRSMRPPNAGRTLFHLKYFGLSRINYATVIIHPDRPLRSLACSVPCRLAESATDPCTAAEDPTLRFGLLDTETKRVFRANTFEEIFTRSDTITCWLY